MLIFFCFTNFYFKLFFRIYAIIATENTDGTKNHGIVLIASYMHMDYAKIATSINTIKFFYFIFKLIIYKIFDLD